MSDTPDATITPLRPDQRFLDCLRATRIEVTSVDGVVLDVGAITPTPAAVRYWALNRRAAGDDCWYHGPSGTEGTLAEMIAGIVWSYVRDLSLSPSSVPGESSEEGK